MAKQRRGRPAHDDLLTPTEWRVVHAIQHGMTNREIAVRRGISANAVKFHVANVLAKLQLPDRRALRQWIRPPKGSALAAKNPKEVRAVVEINQHVQLDSVGQIARSVSDVQASERWYRDALGLTHLYTFGKLTFFDCGGTRLLLTQEETLSSHESILYFRVADILQAHQQFRQRGIDFVSAPHMIHKHADGTEEWMAFFKDPDGRPLALMSQVKR